LAFKEQIEDGYRDAPVLIVVWIGERQTNITDLELSLFSHFSNQGIFSGFISIDEAARKTKHAFTRITRASHQ
jgi:hypothetical protein